MALNQAQQNISSEIQSLALDLLKIKNRLPAILAMYTTEGLTNVADADYAELAPLAHVTVTDMNAAKNTLSAINTAFGDYAAGSQTLYLSRVLTTVPK